MDTKPSLKPKSHAAFGRSAAGQPAGVEASAESDAQSHATLRFSLRLCDATLRDSPHSLFRTVLRSPLRTFEVNADVQVHDVSLLIETHDRPSGQSRVHISPHRGGSPECRGKSPQLPSTLPSVRRQLRHRGRCLVS